MRPRSIVILVLALTGVLPKLVGAQAVVPRRDSAVARLRTGQQIRVTGEGLGLLMGRAGVASGDTLDLTQGDAVRRIPIPAIDTLWVRGGASTEGAIVGGSLGAIFGVLAAAAAQGLDDTGSDASAPIGTYLAGAFMGAFIMGGVGALIGGAVPKWKRKYP